MSLNFSCINAFWTAIFPQVSPIKYTFDDITSTKKADLDKALEDLFHANNFSLVDQERIVGEAEALLKAIRVDTEINLGLSDPTEELLTSYEDSIKAQLAVHKERLEQKAQELKWQKKWLTLGFPKSVLVSHPECVVFMLQSHFGFALEMFKNSTSQGKERHDIRLDTDGHPLIKMEGAWTRWEKINDLLAFDPKSRTITTKGDTKTAWNYISPEGIVKKDMYYYDKIYPVEKISQEELQALKTHAAKFWNTNPEIDEGKEKECVFQISTRWSSDVLPNNHASIRLFDKEGNVYNFGLIQPQEESEYITKGLPFTFLSTITAQIACYDWEETYDFKERNVTSIPLTAERLQGILDYVSEKNKEGVRFNFIKQNCARFAACLLEKAGVQVDLKEPVTTFIDRVGSSMFSLPPIVKAIADRVKAVTTPVLALYESITPQPIKSAVSAIGGFFGSAVNKVAAVGRNLLSFALGSSRMSPPKQTTLALMGETLVPFERLIESPWDILNTELLDHESSFPLRAWQKKQETNCVYAYEGRPKLYMHPNQ